MKKGIRLGNRSERKAEKDAEPENNLVDEEDSVPYLNLIKSPLSPCIRHSQRIPGETKVVRINEVTDVKIILTNGEMKTSPKERISEDLGIQKEEQNEEDKEASEENNSIAETKSSNTKGTHTEEKVTRERAPSLDLPSSCVWWRR